MKRMAVVLFCFTAGLVCSCGGSSGGSGSDTSSGYSVTASVEMPTLSNVSISSKSSRLGKAITEVAAVGVVVQAQDEAGANIGTPCTTGADGTCSVTLTSDQLQAGVVFVSENMHSFQEYDAADIAAADAGTVLTAPVNTQEDVLYAIVNHNCGGALGACPPTIDVDCLHDAVGVLPGDDDPGTDTVDGYIEGLIVAQANALINNPAGATSGLLAALGGNPTAYIADVGSSTVSTANVPVADAVANSQVGASTVSNAYCTRDVAGAESPWEAARAANSTQDATTFSRAMAGMFEYFTPSELQQGIYEPADFRGFMSAGPQLSDFFTSAGGSGNDLARNAFVQGFRNGMFADPTNAPVAMGFIGATFPAPVGGVYDWTGNAFDPETAVMAGRNAFVEMTSASSFNPASFTPNGIFSAFQPAMGDPSRRSTFANGGCSDFVGAFMGNPTGFVPANNFGLIMSPPGGSCSTNNDCMPCDNCVSSGVCVAGSSKMGSSCSTDSDCDAVTLCVGPPNSAFSGVAMKNCMCASGVPTGMGVFTGGDAGPQQYGTTGGYAPPASGAQGGPCGPGQPACGAGLSCTNSQYGGVCVPGAYQYPPGSSCSQGQLCMTGDTCTGGACVAGAGTGGSKTNGMACSFPNECQSWNCMGGICTAMGGGSSGSLKPDGATCSGNAECASAFCVQLPPAPAVCGQPGGGGAVGAWCNSHAMCLSGHCNFGSNPIMCGP